MINSNATAPPCLRLPEVLLIAGSRPEAARLAPVASAMKASGRLCPVTVAGGADPMRVHDAFEALGAPPGVTILTGASPSQTDASPSNDVRVGAALAVRFDDLMSERRTAAVLVAGGGVAALVAAQVGFFHKIPVVHLDAGADVDDVLCPFPEEANRRVIGQLTSLFLHTTGKGVPPRVAGPNSVTVGDTLTGVTPTDPRLAELAARVRRGDARVGVLDASVPSILSAGATLLGSTPGLELVVVGKGAADVWRDPALVALTGNPRAHVVDQTRIRDLLGVVGASAFAATDRSGRYFEALAFGVPAMLVDSAPVDSGLVVDSGPADSRPADSGPADSGLVGSGLAGEPDRSWVAAVEPNVDAVLHAMSSLLGDPSRVPGPGGTPVPEPAAACRVEHAVAWMLGLEQDPVPTGPVSEDPAKAY